jgi:hypothetical protein
MDWAKHRRRKAAAKMHLRLDLHSFLKASAGGGTFRDLEENSKNALDPPRRSGR